MILTTLAQFLVHFEDIILPTWLIKLVSYGVVRWLVGTTVQTGIVVAAVMYFLGVSQVSMDSRMTDLAAASSRIETKVDAGFEGIRSDVAENSVTLGSYTERFNSIDNEFDSVRREMAAGLNGINQALSLIDPTAAEPLRSWGDTYLASASGNETSGDQFSFLVSEPILAGNLPTETGDGSEVSDPPSAGKPSFSKDELFQYLGQEVVLVDQGVTSMQSRMTMRGVLMSRDFFMAQSMTDMLSHLPNRDFLMSRLTSNAWPSEDEMFPSEDFFVMSAVGPTFGFSEEAVLEIMAQGGTRSGMTIIVVDRSEDLQFQ